MTTELYVLLGIVKEDTCKYNKTKTFNYLRESLHQKLTIYLHKGSIYVTSYHYSYCFHINLSMAIKNSENKKNNQRNNIR